MANGTPKGLLPCITLNPIVRAMSSRSTIVAVALAVMFVGAIMPTPLYPLYQHAFEFSGITLTLIYAVYVLGNLVALLFFGRFADQVGRRSAILPAIGIGIASAVVFATASGTAWLFAARALSGFSTGLGAGAATAWIADLYTGRRNRAAARIAASANFLGCAAGPLFRWLARSIRAMAAAAVLSHLSCSALRRRRRHPVRARNGDESETFRRNIIAAAARCAAAHQAPVRVARGERFRHVFADRLLRRLDSKYARRKPA